MLDAQTGALELHFQLQDGVLVDDGLGGMLRHLLYDVSKILRCDVHFFSIIPHVARRLIVPFHEHHEAIEQFSDSVGLHFIRPKLRISLQIFMKSDKYTVIVAT